MKMAAAAFLVAISIIGFSVAQPVPHPAIPFPQSQLRSGGSLTEQAMLDRDCLATWEVIRERLISSENCASGELRVIVDGYDFGGSERPTYSEGIGWGMLFAAIMERPGHSTREIFDGLNAYRKRYLRPSGFMDWRILANGKIGDYGIAVEAEENIAMALLLAHAQWGSEKSTYWTEFRKLTDNLMSDCVLPDEKFLKPGDGWGGKDLLHPANWKLAYWRIWGKVLGEPRWEEVRKSTAELMAQITRISPTGLPPHWCRSDGSPTGSSTPYFAEYTFEYDALQLPIHNELELAWFGAAAAPEAGAMNQKITAWARFSPHTVPSNTMDGFALDGKVTGKYVSSTFVASFLAAAFQHDEAYFRECLSVLRQPRPGSNGYYAALIRLYSLLVVSGNFPDVSSRVSPANGVSQLGE